MTQDEIIEMAKQAGIDVGVWEKLYDDDIFGYSINGTHENLEAFAKLVAQHDREACIKALEDQIGWDMYDPESTATKVIRARGQA